MKNILVGINLSKQSPLILKYAIRLAQYHNAKLVVAHILDTKKEAIDWKNKPEDISEEDYTEMFRKEKQVKLVNFVQQHFPKQYYKVIVHSTVVFGLPDEELRRIAADQSIELIVVGKWTKTGTELLSDVPIKLIEWSPCPVLIVPEDIDYHVFKRIIYATEYELTDCEDVFYLQDWLTVFDAELVGYNIAKTEIAVHHGEQKVAILNKLFTSPKITFKNLKLLTKDKLSDIVKLEDGDLIAARMQDKVFWRGNKDRVLDAAFPMELPIPIIIFQ